MAGPNRSGVDYLLALGFALVAAGHLAGIPLARTLAAQLMWWWPYEILGCLYLMLYLAFLEGMSESLARPRQRLVLLVILFALLAAVLRLVYGLPFGSLGLSGLVLLPGYVPVLVTGGEPERVRFLYRGGRSFCALVLSFFAVAFIASLVERPGVRAAGRMVFEGFVMVLWGALYFAARTFLESRLRRAAVRQGTGRDPRWGG